MKIENDALRFAEMWKKSRMDSGKSQEEVAEALGVSRRTVQNWESGFGCPSQLAGFQWFKVLGLQPLPYYLQLLYPEPFDDISADDDDGRIEAALATFVHSLPPQTKRKLLYCVYGDHGSSPVTVLDMLVAHLHTPLECRLNIMVQIRNNFKLSQAKNKLRRIDHIMPNLKNLENGYASAFEAVMRGEESYTLSEEAKQ